MEKYGNVPVHLKEKLLLSDKVYIRISVRLFCFLILYMYLYAYTINNSCRQNGIVMLLLKTYSLTQNQSS